MMYNTRIWVARCALALAVLAPLPTTGCALFEPQSKVRSGQLFQTGQTAYDDYFQKLHTLQVEAAGWSDDKKASRRPLIEALKIATDSVDVTILQSAHERMVGIAHAVGPTRLDLREDEGKVIVAEARADLSTRDFVRAVQATVDAEMKRKRSLRDVPQRCDDLAKMGRELEPRVHNDFVKQGGTMMADVHDEIAASFEILDQISKAARLDRRETEDFVADLGRAIAADPNEQLHGDGLVVATTTTHSTPRPKPPIANTTTTTATAKPKPPTPKPQPGGGGDEVFNP